MKAIFFSVLLLSTHAFAQTKVDRYIQLVATVDWYGDAVVITYADYPKDKSGQTDSLINAREIDALIKAKSKNKEKPIAVINELAGKDWILISTTFVPWTREGEFSDKGRMFYYLKKTFEKK